MPLGGKRSFPLVLAVKPQVYWLPKEGMAGLLLLLLLMPLQ